MAFIERVRLTSKGNMSVWGGSPKHEKKYSDEEVLSWRDRVIGGETYKQVADSLPYRISRESICRIIMNRYPIEREYILPKDYVSIDAMTTIWGMGYNGVYYHIKHKNIPSVKVDNKIYISRHTEVPTRTLSDEVVDNILLHLSSGLSQREIAKICNVSQGTVSNYKRLFA